MPVGDSVVSAILELVTALRQNKDNIAWAPGPRASQTLMLAARAKALIEGRTAPSIDDVVSLAIPCLQHRMHLQFGAQTQGITAASLISDYAQKL
jgi:MoxR-like ATPase